MINYVKILAKSDALEEQRFKAYFEVKEKADEFVKIFGKTNGSDLRPAERQKADRVSSAAVSSVVEKWENIDHLKSQMLERLAREGGKELRNRGERELTVELR